MFAWGCNAQGRLGRLVLIGRGVSNKSYLRPRRVMNLRIRNAEPQHVACGGRSSFALDKTGRPYAWGQKEYEKLGVGWTSRSESSYVRTPRRVEALEGHDVRSITGGRHHSLACTWKGALFAWRRWAYRALGLCRNAVDEENGIYGDDGSVQMVTKPTRVEGEQSLPRSVSPSDIRANDCDVTRSRENCLRGRGETSQNRH
jgi:regulator of chromosome condensation